jgi:hypothetical protein
VGALDGWCKASDTSYLCTEKFARSMLSFVIGSRLLPAKPTVDRSPDKGTSQKATINIVMITRVFLTRELDTRRLVTSARGGALHIVPARSQPSELQPSSTTGRDNKQEDGAKPTMATQESDLRNYANTSNSGGAFLGQTSESSVGVRQIFPRPVAFGFRSISIVPPDS